MELIEIENGGGVGEMGQRLQTSSYKMISSRDLMYGMVTRVDNTVLYVLYTWHFMKEQILNVMTTKIKKVIMWGDGAVN